MSDYSCEGVEREVQKSFPDKSILEFPLKRVGKEKWRQAGVRDKLVI